MLCACSLWVSVCVFGALLSFHFLSGWKREEQVATGSAIMCSASNIAITTNTSKALSVALANLDAHKPTLVDLWAPESMYYFQLVTYSAAGLFSRTRVVELLPRFYLANRCDRPLLICQKGWRELPRLAPGTQLPVCSWPHSKSPQKLLRVRPEGEWDWSDSFAVYQPRSQDLVPLVDLKLERNSPPSSVY